MTVLSCMFTFLLIFAFYRVYKYNAKVNRRNKFRKQANQAFRNALKD